MHLLTFIPFLTTLLPFVSAARTVYIDSTCTARREWNQIWAEVKQMAESTVELFDHPERNNRQDFAQILEQVFKMELDRHAYQPIVRDAVNEIAQLRIVENFKDALIRIYCDGGELLPRTVPMTFAPSPIGRLGWMPNGGSPRLYDFVNQMSRVDHPCSNDRGALTEGKESRNNDVFWDQRQLGHNADRMVITICDNMWQRVQKTLRSVSGNEEFRITMPRSMLEPIKYVDDGSRVFDYEQGSIDLFFPLPSRVIFHELIHAISNNDIADTEGRASHGWKNVLAITPPRHMRNADSYAMLAQFVLAQDLLGLTLQRPDILPELADNQQAMSQMFSWIQQGRLRSYDDIKKKPLVVVTPP